MTDKIEDVMIRLYINNVKDIRPEAVEFAALLIQCCEALSQMMQEFENFKKSKTLHECLIRINELEEQGDRLFIKSMRKLHKETDNVIDIIAWREIFNYLEKCLRACGGRGRKRHYEKYLMDITVLDTAACSGSRFCMPGSFIGHFTDLR